jgi:isoleucyl-tRNA synthetase
MNSTAPDKSKSISFKDTLNLPYTDFPMASNHGADDPALLARWQAEHVYRKSFELNSGNPSFILHDGPPYANGPIHLGHAYNKITKDIIGKSQRMSGKHVPITPGWDCHGLPIEQKVTKEFPDLTTRALRTECRLYAEKWIEVQKDQFRKLGVLMDWDRPYLTMDYSYEAAVLRAFGIFFQQGYIQKKKKTVPWCPTDRTVLAMAEIEYKEQKDPSLYVLFDLTDEAVKKALPNLAGKKVSAVIWTTTPWTLPLNCAVLVRPQTRYAVLPWQDHYILVGAERVNDIAKMLEISHEPLGYVEAEKLAGLHVHHPFLPRTSPIIADQSVAADEGTAFVHCAPGCGPQDYDIALQHNLEIFSPISPDGKYTVGIEPEELVDMPVSDGQIWVIKKLAQEQKLLAKKTITHSYPHCWRCHNSLIFRATDQWFCDLAHKNLRQKALDSLASITFLPKNSQHFLKATLEGRLEWCLSRQRTWGVPIPALSCVTCQWVYTSQKLINKVADGVEQQGIEYWDDVAIPDLLKWLVKDLCCKQCLGPVKDLRCKQCLGVEFTKERDILDVWFESGISHYAVLSGNPELKFPADLYVEGVDQHRAWFQSSLLTSLVLDNQAPTRAFLTHGFVVDEKGHKMSKSLGNVVEPGDIVKQLGTDGLRLWTASIDYGTSDAVVSKVLLNNVGQVYRKIRNTCRFLLANLYDFSFTRHAVAIDELLLLDQYALHELCRVNHAIRTAYDSYNFTGVYHQLTDYCTVSLSSRYLDIIKDRLYTDAAASHERRSAQTVCYLMLDTLTRLCAPILSFMAEQVSDLYQQNKKESIHLQKFSDLTDIWQVLARKRSYRAYPLLFYPYIAGAQFAREKIEEANYVARHEQEWDLLLRIRDAVLKAIEELRAAGTIKHSLEARVRMHMKFSEEQQTLFDEIAADLKKSGQTLEDFFKEFFIVSQIEFVPDNAQLRPSLMPGLWLAIEKAKGEKCPRCWQWTITDHPLHLCDRCQGILRTVITN